MSKTDSVNQGGIQDWRDIPWRELEKRVFKLQKRIYQASENGDDKTVRKLQKIVLSSWSAKCLAVRKVTQDNQGKKTAGVDGVKSLSPKQRLELVNKLKLSSKAKPARRIWIDKVNSTAQRPLSIATMFDRALQALVKLALEPEWEARFEANSYGFRPGRSAHDAIVAIRLSLNKQAKYILDADIQKCFEKIDHKKLLTKVNTFPRLRRQLRAWLKAGVIDDGELYPTEEGAAQGSVVSPLLTNIALQGLEALLKDYAETVAHKVWVKSKGHWEKASKARKRQRLGFAIYADDFVVLHPDLDVILKCKELCEDWLADMGLALKPSKTRIAHSLNAHEAEPPGFDFLGFNIRHYQAGNHNAARAVGKRLTYRLKVKPSDASVKKHLAKLRQLIKAQQHTSQAELIRKLNPLIRGWTRYFATVHRSDTMRKLNHLLFIKLRAWANRRHNNKGQRWLVRKYWKTIKGNNWTFADEHSYLQHYFDQKFIRHAKVKGSRSPFDGDWLYWTKRMGKHPLLPGRIARLIQTQKGRCPECQLFFKSSDQWEIDHRIPKHQGGSQTFANLQLLHKHCHHKKTRTDLRGGTHDKGQLTEEPCEVNVCAVSRTKIIAT